MAQDRLAKAIARLQRLRGMPGHVIEPPASADAVEAARSRLGVHFTDDLAQLYGAMNGFKLQLDEERSEAALRLCPLDSLLPASRSGPQEWEVRLHGDPNRLRVFYGVNGDGVSFTLLGTKTGFWLDDWRENPCDYGLIATNLTVLLESIAEQVASGRIDLRRTKEVPSGYKRALDKLIADEAAKVAEANRRWNEEHPNDPDNDWSDL